MYLKLWIYFFQTRSNLGWSNVFFFQYISHFNPLKDENAPYASAGKIHISWCTSKKLSPGNIILIWDNNKKPCEGENFMRIDWLVIQVECEKLTDRSVEPLSEDYFVIKRVAALLFGVRRIYKYNFSLVLASKFLPYKYILWQTSSLKIQYQLYLKYETAKIILLNKFAKNLQKDISSPFLFLFLLSSFRINFMLQTWALNITNLLNEFYNSTKKAVAISLSFHSLSLLSSFVFISCNRTWASNKL